MGLQMGNVGYYYSSGDGQDMPERVFAPGDRTTYFYYDKPGSDVLLTKIVGPEECETTFGMGVRLTSGVNRERLTPHEGAGF